MKQKRKLPDHAPRVRQVASARLPTRFGFFRVIGLASDNGDPLVALLHGDLKRRTAPLVRIHSQCLTGDVFASRRCDCRAQLELALRMVARRGAGVILYEPEEGRGIGLLNKLRAYELQDRGMDTVEANEKLGFAADQRNYQLAATALRALGLRQVRLLSNNPEKVQALEAAGIKVVERVPCQPLSARGSRSYLRVKKEKMGHLLEL